jgi:hypothetical protein
MFIPKDFWRWAGLRGSNSAALRRPSAVNPKLSQNRRQGTMLIENRSEKEQNTQGTGLKTGFQPDRAVRRVWNKKRKTIAACIAA